MTSKTTDQGWWPFGVPPAGALGRLFCFPYAGAGASAYATWHRHAPPGLAVVPAQLPGREHRLKESAEPNLHRLVDKLAPAIEPFTGERYALFGHSMGALIAFELARALRRRGCPLPDAVFVSGRGAPGVPIARRQIHMLSDRQFIDEIRSLSGTPDAILEHPEFTSLFLPALRADFALVETYSATDEPPLASPISAFGGVDDTIPREALEAWRLHTTARFQLRMLPGGHFVVASARTAILQAVADDLAAAVR